MLLILHLLRNNFLHFFIPPRRLLIPSFLLLILPKTFSLTVFFFFFTSVTYSHTIFNSPSRIHSNLTFTFFSKNLSILSFLNIHHITFVLSYYLFSVNIFQFITNTSNQSRARYQWLIHRSFSRKILTGCLVLFNSDPCTYKKFFFI